MQVSKHYKAGGIKYFGVVNRKRLTFLEHLIAIAERVCKLILISTKNFRMSVGIGLPKLTYKALCQFIINFSLTVWGGAGKVNKC